MFEEYFLAKKIKKISIRGRIAFGIKCIESYVVENDLDSFLMSKLIENLWEFTSENNLVRWHDKIVDLDPWNILDSHPNNNYVDYKTLTKSEFYEFKKFYNSLDNDFINMIGNVIEIGTGNLYGGVGKFSNETLEPTLQVFRISKCKLNKIPNIKRFQFSKFTEFGGWGSPFDNSVFI